ncbi:MAG: LysR family transcriptional regulator [Myxococcaceae bacterium]|nr:LysR family transcriptional regulator [Myxococcaceae bacterium]
MDPFAGVLTFVRTAEARSFSRAAAALGVTTAAVSKAVKRLEDELGVRLLERSSRSVALTREGELFLERSRQAVFFVQGAREALKGAAREPHGALAVTLPFILAPFIVPQLGRLTAQYPRLSLRLSLTDRLARLPEEGIDVAIRMGRLASSSLVSRLLRRTQWVTVGAPLYLAARPALRNPAELVEHNCLRFVGPDGKARPWAFRADGRASTVRVGGNLQVDHGSQLVVAAEAGQGLAQVLDFMVVDALQAGRLVEVLGAFATSGPPIYAVTTPGRAASPNVRAFIRFAVECLRA